MARLKEYRKGLLVILLAVVVVVVVVIGTAEAAWAAEVSVTDQILSLVVTLGSLGTLLVGAYISINKTIEASKKEMLVILKEVETELKTTVIERYKELELENSSLKKELEIFKELMTKRGQKNIKNLLKLSDKINQIVRVTETIQIEVDVNGQHIDDLFSEANLVKRKNPRVPTKIGQIDSRENLDELVDFESVLDMSED